MKNMQPENRVCAWANISERYIRELVTNVVKYLSEWADARWKLPQKKADNPFIGDYALAMDETNALEHDVSFWYQYFIGMLRWMAEIGRVEIITKVSMMAIHMAIPREGHLEAVLNVFAFLCQKYNSVMAFEPTYHVINMNGFKECNCKDLYWYLKEAIPPNSPEERGKEVDLRGYVESDHAGEKNTRRSWSGFLSS